MSGNCATGRALRAITPAIEMTIEMTIASRGRWMKTVEIIFRVRPCLTRRRGCLLRRHRHPRPDALLALDHDALAGLDTFLDDGEPLAAGAETDPALLHLV